MNHAPGSVPGTDRLTSRRAGTRRVRARMFGTEVADELRGIVREPTALFFSIVMPVAFFALFVSLFGTAPSTGAPTGTRMLATFGTFGVLAVTLLNPGVRVAQERESGWLRAKLVSAVPPRLTLMAKVAATLPYAVGVLVAMGVTAAVVGVLDSSPVALLRLATVLLLGSLPFALLSMAVGFQAGLNTTVAVLNAILLPSAVLSGLWMPLEIMPQFIGDIARFLPPYHVAQLGLAQLDGTMSLDHLLVLAGFTVLTALLALVSYRRSKL